MHPGVVVVEMGDDLEARASGVIHKRNGTVEIEMIGMIVVDEIDDSVFPRIHPVFRGFQGMPDLVVFIANLFGAGRFVVQVFKIRIIAVVGNAFAGSGGIGAFVGLKPAVTSRQMGSGAPAQADFEAFGAHFGADVAFGSVIQGVPFGLESGVPEVEIVVVDGHGHNVSGAGVSEQIDPFGGIESGGVPRRDYVFIAHSGGVAPVFEMIAIGGAAFLVHFPGIPAVVGAFGRGLGVPVAVDAEFRILVPLGGCVPAQGFDGGLEECLLRLTHFFDSLGARVQRNIRAALRCCMRRIGESAKIPCFIDITSLHSPFKMAMATF